MSVDVKNLHPLEVRALTYIEPGNTVSSDDLVQSYSVDEFSKMTFLTPFGVKEWLRKGILRGSQTSSGDWRVDGSSLNLDPVKRLLR